MKKTAFLLLAALVAPAAVLLVGCSRNDSASTSADKFAAGTKAVAANVQDAVSDSWNSIKDFTYAKRVEFSASMDRISAQMDDKARMLKAKVAAVPDDAAKDRDAAIKEYDEARSDLKSRLTDLGNATADTWAEAKGKVAQAWQRVQVAYDKVVSSGAS